VVANGWGIEKPTTPRDELALLSPNDGTYFVVESYGDIAGCGGWSRRATLYGGNQTAGRDGHLLDPKVDPARVRAMYTNPAYARRGVGRLILSLCEAAAAAEGFTRLELMSTLSGEPLYITYGFKPRERLEASSASAAAWFYATMRCKSP
jgi:GNAT superfamily N-acetyltransferase